MLQNTITPSKVKDIQCMLRDFDEKIYVLNDKNTEFAKGVHFLADAFYKREPSSVTEDELKFVCDTFFKFTVADVETACVVRHLDDIFKVLQRFPAHEQYLERFSLVVVYKNLISHLHNAYKEDAVQNFALTYIDMCKIKQEKLQENITKCADVLLQVYEKDKESHARSSTNADEVSVMCDYWQEQLNKRKQEKRAFESEICKLLSIRSCNLNKIQEVCEQNVAYLRREF